MSNLACSRATRTPGTERSAISRPVATRKAASCPVLFCVPGKIIRVRILKKSAVEPFKIDIAPQQRRQAHGRAARARARRAYHQVQAASAAIVP